MSCVGSYIIPVKADKRAPVRALPGHLATNDVPAGPGAGTLINIIFPWEIPLNRTIPFLLVSIFF